MHVFPEGENEQHVVGPMGELGDGERRRVGGERAVFGEDIQEMRGRMEVALGGYCGLEIVCFPSTIKKRGVEILRGIKFSPRVLNSSLQHSK